jgi:hypothetical protein
MKFKIHITEDFKPFLLIVLAYAIGIGFPYLFQYIFKFRVPFSFWISEQDLLVNYDISSKLFMDVVFTSPFFAVCSYFGFRMMLKRMSEERFSKRFKDISLSLFLVFLTIFCMGHVIHVVANHLNGKVSNLGLEETNLFYAVYFWDEYIGHTTIGVGFYGIFLLMSLLNIVFLIDDKKKYKEEQINVNRNDKYWALFVGAIGGLIQAQAFLEGQCNFIFLIVNPASLLSFYLISLKYKFDFKKSSFIWGLIAITISYSIFTFIWVGFTGIKPYYPFFYQGSELS